MDVLKCFKHKRAGVFIAIGVAAVLAAAAFLMYLLFVKKSPLEAALELKSYNMVQVLTTVKITDNTPSEEQDEETQEPEASPSTTARLKKDGDVIFENDIRGNCYYFPQNGENCVLYLDVGNGMEETGVWTRALRSDIGAKPSVDFDAVAQLSPDDLLKDGDWYVPEASSLKKNVQAFTGWSDSSFEDYTDISLRISIDKKRVKEVRFSFENPEKYFKYEFFYTFTYEDIPITLPTEGATGVLQSLS